MSYSRLGRTNMMVSRCVFGAGGLYRTGGDLRLLETAIDRGMNCIDTGRAYGTSEAAISGILRRHSDKCWIISKAGHIGWPDMIVKPGEDSKAGKLYTDQLDESLRALQVDHVDCYMVQGVEHDWVVTMDGLYDAFTKARQAGKVRYFGLSTHTNVPKVCSLAAKSGRYDIVTLSVNPNSLKGGPADKQVQPLAPVIQAMREAGIGVISMKTSGPIAKDPKVYDQTYDATYGGLKLSPYQQAYAYLLARGGVDAFVSHMPNYKILEENLAVPTLTLSQAAMDGIEERALADTRGACRHCGACSRACPEGIPVADMLRCHSYVHTYGQPEMAKALYETQGKDQTASCRDCGTCRGVCPESIDLPAVISSVRRMWS